MQGVLTSSVGTPVAVLCVDAAGRYCRKYVVPAQWDPSAPKSLLGCQMSNQCPADHPAIRAAARSGRRGSGSAPARTAPLGSKRSPSPGLQAPERACCARCALIVASMLQLCLVAAIFGLPRISPGAANLLRLASLDCSAGGSSAITADSSPDASALAGRKLSLPKANPPDPFGAGASSLAQLDYAGVGLLTAGRDAGGAAHLLSGLQLDGQLDMEDLLLGILIACCVLAFISLLGLVVACSQPRSCTRTAATTLYYVTTLPVWVALGFAVAFCFVFRAESESLVSRYWLCAPSTSTTSLPMRHGSFHSTTRARLSLPTGLLLTEPAHLGGAAQTAWGAAAAVYKSITLVASLLLSANVLLLVGLYSASRVVGAGIVAASLLNVINLGQLLVGGGLCAVAAGLHARSEGGGGGLHADTILLALGGGVAGVSILGLLASRLHSGCLLRLYGLCALLGVTCLAAFVCVLSLLGVGNSAVSGFADPVLSQNWHYIRDVYPISKDDFLHLLSRHNAKLAIAGGLLLFVQLLALIATCVLRNALLSPKESASASERAGLISDDEDDDEEQMV